MHTEVSIREETINDYKAISEVNCLAFNQDDEAQLVERLRSNGDVVLSLVAEFNDKVIGHIALSRMFVEEMSGNRIKVLALAPVAVLPNFQKKGVGSRLIREAIRIAQEGTVAKLSLKLGLDMVY